MKGKPLKLHIMEAETCVIEAERCIRLVENVDYPTDERKGLLMAAEILIRKAKTQIAMAKIYKQ